MYFYPNCVVNISDAPVVKLNNNGGENWLKQLMNTRYHRIRSTIESGLWFLG
jgi:hypothetical protein